MSGILDKIVLSQTDGHFWDLLSRFMTSAERNQISNVSSIVSQLSSAEVKLIIIELASANIKRHEPSVDIVPFCLLPSETFDLISQDIDMKDMLNLSCTCWEMFDHLQLGIREKAHTCDETKWEWKLSLYKIYAASKTDASRYSSLLKSHTQFASVWDFLVDGKEFSFISIFKHHISATRIINMFQDLFKGDTKPDWMKWLIEFGDVLSLDLVKIVLEKLENVELTGPFIDEIMQKQMFPKEWLVYLCNYWRFSNVQELKGRLKSANSFSIKLAFFKGAFIQGASDSEIVPLILKHSQTPKQLLEILNTVPRANLVAVPSACFDQLLDDRFDSKCWFSFISAFPNFSVSPSIMNNVHSKKMGNELVARLILKLEGPSSVVSAALLSMPIDTPEDLYLVLFSRCLKSDIDVLKDVIRRKFSNSVVKYLIRMLVHTRITLSCKQNVVKAAIRNGYADDTVAFIEQYLEAK